MTKVNYRLSLDGFNNLPYEFFYRLCKDLKIGKYQIEYCYDKICIKLIEINKNADIIQKNGRYYISNQFILNSSEFIDFNIKEFRDFQINKLLY